MEDKRLDVEKIAQGLGAQRVGKVRSSGGYFGAMQLAADVEEELVLQRDPSRRNAR